MANSESKTKRLLAFFIAVVIYAAFAVYLYFPHLVKFSTYRSLLIPAAVLAASGTYLLSTRWISNPIASFFAGLLYAFVPFMLGFALYHPAASLLPALLPFTLLPAVFWPHRPFRLAPLITAALATLPFITIVVFFTIAAHYGLYPIPHNQKLRLTPCVGLLTPLLLKPSNFPYPGFYHVAVAPLIFGMFLFFRIHRIGAMLFCAISINLAFYAAIGQTSPIIWATLPILCFSIVAGLGLEGLSIASAGDVSALVSCAIFMAVLALSSALLSLKTEMAAQLLHAAAWYIASAFAVYLILLLATKERRARLFRWSMLSLLMSIDIFFAARTIIDRLF